MNKSIEIKLEADTTKLSLTLKAIAKHAEALSNELESINKKYNDVEMCNDCNK